MLFGPFATLELAYLLGHKCIVYTDHAPLKLSLTVKHQSGRRACWNELMADYHMEIRYKPGKKNANADALFRAPVATSTETVSAILGSSVLQPVDNSDHNILSSHQKADPQLKEVIVSLTNHKDVILTTKQPQTSTMVLIDDILIDPQSSRLRIVVPIDMRTELMKEAHSGAFSGHFAAQGLFHKVAKQYWWKGMYTDIYHYCRSCLTCASYSGSGRKAHFLPCNLFQLGHHLNVLILTLQRCPEHAMVIAMCR